MWFNDFDIDEDSELQEDNESIGSDLDSVDSSELEPKYNSKMNESLQLSSPDLEYLKDFSEVQSRK